MKERQQKRQRWRGVAPTSIYPIAIAGGSGTRVAAAAEVAPAAAAASAAALAFLAAAFLSYLFLLILPSVRMVDGNLDSFFGLSELSQCK